MRSVFLLGRPHVGIVRGRQAIAFAIEAVVVFVIQTFDQINSTIGSTSDVVPHTLCVYTHKRTLVYIYIYIYTQSHQTISHQLMILANQLVYVD